MDNLVDDSTIRLMIDEAAGDIDNVPLPSDGESVVGSVLDEQLANLGEIKTGESVVKNSLFQSREIF